jgi:hypothetical protein
LVLLLLQLGCQFLEGLQLFVVLSLVRQQLLVLHVLCGAVLLLLCCHSLLLLLLLLLMLLLCCTVWVCN